MQNNMKNKLKCDCKFNKNQVCDICQGVNKDTNKIDNIHGRKVSRERSLEGLGDPKDWKKFKEKVMKDFKKKPNVKQMKKDLKKYVDSTSKKELLKELDKRKSFNKFDNVMKNTLTVYDEKGRVAGWVDLTTNIFEGVTYAGGNNT